ncbi:hypothetical protein ACQ4PT_021830 [Festuca glaucescens]
MSSVSLGLPERLGYVQCKFCTTILLVSVPCSSLLLKMVAVQCGRCSGILSVSVASPPPSPPSPSSVELPLQELGVEPPPREWSDESSGADDDGKGEAVENNAAAVNKPPVRKQRTPSAYNCFINGLTYPEFSTRETEASAAGDTCKLRKTSHNA